MDSKYFFFNAYYIWDQFFNRNAGYLGRTFVEAAASYTKSLMSPLPYATKNTATALECRLTFPKSVFF